jgi:hypothetical protein
MKNLIGFWSYVHADDEAEINRISKLARDISEQVEMITCEKLSLFLDKDDLEWGDQWRNKLDLNITTLAFFIPILTPRYFASPECRREYQHFLDNATNLGIHDFVLPLLYVDVPQLHTEKPEDELIAFTKDYQWEDWREIRFAEPDSREYRKAVSSLAAKIADTYLKNREKTKQKNVDLNKILTNYDDDSPGIIDRLAGAEESLPLLNSIMEDLGENIKSVGKLMENSTADIKRGDQQNSGFSHRIIIAKKLASHLEEPAKNINRLSGEYLFQLNRLNDGFLVISELASEEINKDPDSKKSLCNYFKQVKNLSLSAHEALEKVQAMNDSLDPLLKISKDLRPVVRLLREGLNNFLSSGEISNRWVEIINSLTIDCE